MSSATETIDIIKKGINSITDINGEDIELLRFQFFKKTNKLKVILKSKFDISNFSITIKKLIKNTLGYPFDIDLVFYEDISNITLEDICNKYWNILCSEVLEYLPVARDLLIKGEINVFEDTIKIEYGNKFLCNYLIEKGIVNLLKNSIKDIYGLKCSIEIEFNKSLMLEEEKLDISNYVSNPIENNQKKYEVKKVETFTPKPKPEVKKQVKKSYEETDSIIIGKNIIGETIDIKEAQRELNNYVIISGEIFKLEIKETKTGKKILTFHITDYEDSISVKCFLKENQWENVINDLKVGNFYKVKGQIIYDQFIRENILKGNDIVKLSPIERMDDAPEKRVEFHLHTNMSSMDGMTNIKKYVERASKWGHSALAVTDHGIVQAFPDAMDAGKKYGVKIIYGVEAYLVDDGESITINGSKDEFSSKIDFDHEYVIFDIETTGFSPINDKIIEIGAVKIKNGEVIDEFSCFVNPDRDIPYKITELTGINNDMVKDSEKINKVIHKFHEFTKGSVLVAHNAKFDTSFIYKNGKDENIKFNNPVLDTLTLSRYMFPELKKHKLNIVANHLKIPLLNHHRAVDDAKATSEILLACFKQLKARDINDLETLNIEYLKVIDIKKLPTHHVIILAKNQVGLKNLYNLISKSHLDYFFKRPRMPKNLINAYREGLIIGSACENGEVFQSVLSGKDPNEIKNMIDFYDYLEIQPIGNNEFLFRNGTVKSKSELQDLNKKIIKLGEIYNKPVIATGDVHFLDEKDSVYRKILMRGQGFSDAELQPPLYLRTTKEMINEFLYLGESKAYEVVVKNTLELSNSIENVKPIPDETFTPKIDGAEDEVRNMTMKKASEIYGENLPKIVQERIDKELNSIIGNGYAVLYLIAHKLVAKSLEDGYLVGSRGSVGSSIVATFCGITEVNGLPPHYVCPNCKNSEFITDGSVNSGVDLEEKNCPKCGTKYNANGHDIPFETFLGFEGDKEPDIDLNFSGKYQGIVHKYTETLFGKGFVFKAGTIGTLADKTAYGFVKKYLDECDKTCNMAEIERLTQGCTGIKRTTGQHPGGIMVVPRDNDIHNFTPIQHPADDMDSDIVTTHFDYHSISGRILKLDILGHDDPTILRMLMDLTGIDPRDVPLNDKKVMGIFLSPEPLGLTREELKCELGTYGIPEFGTKFVRQMLIQTKPKNFSDLVRISGLSHGTDVWLNNAQYFIKEGYTTLKDCIATRDDIMVYLMHKGLPSKKAFTIMEAVRKGKGLKSEDEEIMKQNNVPDWYIESCKKIKYMFPKGHAVAYVMMAVRIAYFKVYHKEAYYATYFTVRADDFDAELITKGESAILSKMEELNSSEQSLTQKEKGLLTILEMSYEMYKRGIKFLKVDLYKSHHSEFLIEDGNIRPPLKSLQGVGENAAKSIFEKRSEREFISIEDLRVRSKVTKTVIETLTVHGCLEGIPETNQLCLF